MSRTDRAEKPEPQEQDFPYVRRCCTGGPCDQAHAGPGAVYNLALHVPPPPPGTRRLRVRPIREAPGLRERVIAHYTHD